MRVALYLRRSTDDQKQPESLAAQEERLRAFAAARQDVVVEVFADSASGTSIKRRREFARLMEAVQHHPTFDAIFVRDVTRWGRFENVDESAYWEFFCLANGVPVVYAEERFSDAPRPYDAILKTMRRMYAAEFSREKARLIQAAPARRVSLGFRAGTAPFGMHVVEYNREGTEPRRLADGQRGHFKLETNNDASSRTVRRVFRWFVKDELAVAEITRRLNAAGVRSPRHGRWSDDTVKHVLRNPAYAGVSEARFVRSENFADETVISTPNAWTPLVSPKVYAAAQERFRGWARRRVGEREQVIAAMSRWAWRGPVEETARACRSGPLRGAITRTEVIEDSAAALLKLDGMLKSVYGAEGGSVVLLREIFQLQQLYSYRRVHQGFLTSCASSGSSRDRRCGWRS